MFGQGRSWLGRDHELARKSVACPQNVPQAARMNGGQERNEEVDLEVRHGVAIVTSVGTIHLAGGSSGRPDAFSHFLGQLLSFFEYFFGLLFGPTPPPSEDLGRRIQKLLWPLMLQMKTFVACTQNVAIDLFLVAILANSSSFLSVPSCEPLTFYVVSSAVTSFSSAVQSRPICNVGLSPWSAHASNNTAT